MKNIDKVANAVLLMDKQLREELLIKDGTVQAKKLWERIRYAVNAVNTIVELLTGKEKPKDMCVICGLMAWREIPLGFFRMRVVLRKEREKPRRQEFVARYL